MNHIKMVNNSSIIFFRDINLATSILVAKEMNTEIIDFFQKNPKKIIILKFNYFHQTLSYEFTKELFAGHVFEKYIQKIVPTEINPLDENMITEVIEEMC